MQFDYNLIETYAASFRDNFDLPALTDYDTDHPMLTYGMMAERIAGLHLLFNSLDIKPGDKIAICGKNSSEWVIAFMSTLTYGAVLVPILHEFSPDDITSIANHSDAVLMFVSDSIFSHLDFEKFPETKAFISLDDSLKVLAERGSKKASNIIAGLAKEMRRWLCGREFGARDINYKSIRGSNTAIINYTSGTSGFSKGVMLTMDNLGGNVKFGVDSQLHYSGSRCLSFLPLAHAYGCAFDLLVPLAVGTHVTFLGKTPTPRTLIKAFAEVKPNLVLCVPLILEKIYKKLIVPALSKRSVRAGLMIPGVDRLIYRQVRQKLNRAFGGAFEEIIVGGAPMNSQVEAFLKKIGFRFTVGYGMTECGPLISYTPWRKYKLYSSGRTLPDLMEARISVDEAGRKRGENTGEILVRGVNVMKGYFKRPDLTEEALEKDGWLHTGDMGYLDEDGVTIFIQGRYKTMILGPSGQNIYPEAIENRINVHPYVTESIVVERDGKVCALVYPDDDALRADGVSEDKYQAALDLAIRQINSTLAPFERVGRTVLMSEPFEKTPKKSIKRYLYK